MRGMTGGCPQTSWALATRKSCTPTLYLILGSSNWSISSEANLELSAVLMVEDADTRTYVEGELAALQTGAVEHFRHELVRALEAYARRFQGGQSNRPRTRATG